jgi:uncharacterized protein
MQQTNVVLGASDNPQRFSNKAIRQLLAHGYHVTPVSPKLKEVEGLPCANNLSQIQDAVGTLTVYVNPQIFSSEIAAVIQLAPKRVIFNPGTESKAAQQALESAGIIVLNQCTLVMLDNNTYST